MEIAAVVAGLMFPWFWLRISCAYSGILRCLAVPDEGSSDGGGVDGGEGVSYNFLV
jgi:hypothetical protein